MNWVRVEDIDFCEWVYSGRDFLCPIIESHSLHCLEEQFELNDTLYKLTLYKLSGPFSSDDYIVEEWK